MAPTIKSELHIDNDEDQKTHIGGVVTIIAKFVLLWVIYTGGAKMVMRQSPYLQSNEINVPLEHKQLNRIGDLNQIHYAILDHNDRYYTLEETKRYIEFKIIHVLYYYQDGKEKKNITRSSVKDCERRDFDRDDNQRLYYDSEVVKKKHNFTCLSEEALNMTIEGNIQVRKVYQQRNSYISLQIDRCTNVTDDPQSADFAKCASHEAINQWLYNKQLEPLAFDNRPAMKNFEHILRPVFR